MIHHSDVVFYDMVGKLRKNEPLMRCATQFIDAAEKITAGIARGKGKPYTHENYTKMATAAIGACGYNFGGLLGSFIPSFRDDKPFSIVERPFMAAMSTLSPGTVVLKAGRQVGKCATGDTVVETDKLGRLRMDALFDLGVPVS